MREEKGKEKEISLGLFSLFFFFLSFFSLLLLYKYRNLSLFFFSQLFDLFCSSSDCSLQIVSIQRRRSIQTKIHYQFKSNK